ncbi:reverse transcriptase domain-containing protein [Tanacetum coccineum]
MSEIRELHAADRRRHAVISEMLKADHRRSAKMRDLRTTDHTRQQQLIQTLTVMQSLQGQLCSNWWNSHVLTVSHDVAYAMTWADLRKKMTDKYCPRNKMKKLEAELWNLKSEGTDENKRKFDTFPKQSKPNNNRTRGRNTGWLRIGEKAYGGSKPLCAKCNYHHDGPCAPKCHKCNKFGHFARDCRSARNDNNANNQRGIGSCHKSTCFECGVKGHFKRECPKLKNNKNPWTHSRLYMAQQSVCSGEMQGQTLTPTCDGYDLLNQTTMLL